MVHDPRVDSLLTTVGELKGALGGFSAQLQSINDNLSGMKADVEHRHRENINTIDRSVTGLRAEMAQNRTDGEESLDEHSARDDKRFDDIDKKLGTALVKVAYGAGAAAMLGFLIAHVDLVAKLFR